MKTIMHRGIPWAVCILTGFAASAQTPPDTNAAPGQLESPLLQTNIPANPAPILWPALTNQFGPQPVPTQPGVLTNMSDMTGPNAPGGGMIGSPLMGTGSFGGASAFGGAPAPSSGGLLRWGPFDFHPYAGYSFLSESGIGSQPGRHNGTIVNTLTEGIAVNLGSRWALNYGASSAFYSGSGYSDSTSQFVSLSGSAEWHDWLFGLSQTYSESSAPLVETGTQTSQVGYGTSLAASRKLGSKLSFFAGAMQSLRYTSQFNDVEAWSGSSGLNYQFFPQLSVGLAASGGYDSVSHSANIDFEEIQGVIGFHPGQRLSLNLSGGVEEQQFVGANAPTLVTPVFAVSAGYLLADSTVLTITAARTAVPSFFTNQDSVSTVLSLGLQHRLTTKLGVMLSGGYTSASYINIEPNFALPGSYYGNPPVTPLSVVRNDSYSFVGASLHYALMQRLTASAFYSYSENSSSQGNFAYSSSQVGFQLRYQY
jgi:hypothetical protein